MPCDYCACILIKVQKYVYEWNGQDFAMIWDTEEALLWWLWVGVIGRLVARLISITGNQHATVFYFWADYQCIDNVSYFKGFSHVSRLVHLMRWWPVWFPIRFQEVFMRVFRWVQFMRWWPVVSQTTVHWSLGTAGRLIEGFPSTLKISTKGTANLSCISVYPSLNFVTSLCAMLDSDVIVAIIITTVFILCTDVYFLRYGNIIMYINSWQCSHDSAGCSGM